MIFLLFLVMAWVLSYIKMLERQEGDLRAFAPAIIKLLENPNQVIELNGDSGRFLTGAKENYREIIAAKYNWIYVDQMGASITFRFQQKEFPVGCQQFTAHFMVCKRVYKE